MAHRVVFIDTSVLLNVLRVPNTGNQGDQDADRQKFAALYDEGVQLVLPVTTIIETGNAIASLDGEKHSLIKTFVGFLQETISGNDPWMAAGFSNTTDLLRHLLRDPNTPLLALMHGGVGTARVRGSCARWVDLRVVPPGLDRPRVAGRRRPRHLVQPVVWSLSRAWPS